MPSYPSWTFIHDEYSVHRSPNSAALQSNMPVQKALACLKADVDVLQFADLSLVTRRPSPTAPKPIAGQSPMITG